jgi:hypothetical protein
MNSRHREKKDQLTGTFLPERWTYLVVDRSVASRDARTTSVCATDLQQMATPP